MDLRSSLVVCVVGAGMMSVSLQAQTFAKAGEHSRAVDAQGVVHTERVGHGVFPSWFKDCMKPIAPEYPYSARVRHQTGDGRFRLQLNLKTGAATQITVIKSTGFQSLDAAALTALGKWRWKPGRWKEVDIPVTFTLLHGPVQLPPGAVPLPKA